MKLSFKPVQDHAIGLEEIVEHDALDEFPEMPKHIKDGFISAKAFHDSGDTKISWRMCFSMWKNKSGFACIYPKFPVIITRAA